MSETSERKLSPIKILAIIGMAVASAMFLGALFIGMSIDPRVDMTGRLVAYTMALMNLPGIFACRWILATGDRERKFCIGLVLATLAIAVTYGAAHLIPRL